MEWEMPYMAQKAMQARRVRQMEMVDREAAGETDSLPPSEEGHDALEDDHGSNDDVEAATSLLGGGKSRYHRIAAAVERNEKDEKEDGNEGEARDHRHSPCLSLLAASLCPCYLLGRGTTLLTEEERVKEGWEDGNKKAAGHLSSEGWWTCLSSWLLASVCPLPCLWPTLACTHRRRQREEIKQQYPHFPSLTPSSTSSSSRSSSSSSSSYVWSFVCGLLSPCPLVQEVSFLEEMKRRRNVRRRREVAEVEVAAALSVEVGIGAEKADGKWKGGATASVDTKWEPFEGWDMRPVTAAAAAAAPAVSAVEASGDRDEAGEKGEEGEWDKNDETSTKDVIIDL